MTETILHDLDAYERALAASPRALLFKHSPACPLSAAARAEYDAFARSHADAATWFVDVIADRPLARGIAERCGVRHESPQAILFVASRPRWHAAHGAITAAALAEAWATTR